MKLPSSIFRAVAAALACLFLAPAWAQGGKVREVDRVVAVVNSDVITARELDARVRLVQAQLRAQRIELPPPDVLEKQVLERMIVDRAQLQVARDYGIRVDDLQVDRAIARIAQENNVSPAQLRQRVEAEGTSFPRFREQIREQIARARLREREVDSKVQISEADVDAFLAEQGQASGNTVEYNLAQILLRIPEGATPEQIERQRLRAEEIRRQLASGADFARLSASFSDAPEAMSGGSLGWRSAERLPQLFLDAVSPLSPGQLSAVLRSPAGFHILKLVERRGAGASQFSGRPIVQTRASHILIRLSDVLGEAEAVRRLREIRDRVLAGSADFGDMAKQYSMDGTAGRGGDLGWVYPGDTVPEFERAMNELQPGQVSQPVRTPFGFHLIRVAERRTDEASPDRVRQAARQALRERRLDEAYENWLRQVRDQAFVEYKLE